MKRVIAESFVGKVFRAWTALNGEYLVRLDSVFGSPWRGRCTVLAIVSAPQWCSIGSASIRRPFEEGRVIEIGGKNLTVFSGDVQPYRESVFTCIQTEIERFQTWKSRVEANSCASYPGDIWLINSSLAALDLYRNEQFGGS